MTELYSVNNAWYISLTLWQFIPVWLLGLPFSGESGM